MNSFRTELRPSEIASRRFIEHSDMIVAIGSCFAENVARKMSADLMTVCANPLGTMFNPASIDQTITRLAEHRLFTADDLFENQGLWRTFDAHSRLADPDPARALEKLNEAVSAGAGAVSRASTFILTLGTAWVFTDVANNRVVANCHKLPANRFDRTCLTVDQAGAALQHAMATLLTVAPEATVILTVSPVRHLADGLHGNNISKATLMLAAEAVANSLPEVVYFPAFELLNDDLRDYRFYAADMLHPSETAIDYIYERFAESFFTPAAVAACSECRKLSRRLAHRAENSSAADAIFAVETDRQLNELRKKYPYK